MRAAVAVFAAAVAAFVVPPLAGATTYYVASAGNDANSGTSTAAPWHSVAKVNGARLAAGDSVLFEGGSSFAGLLRPVVSGTSTAPITFGSYGTSRANLPDGIAVASESWLVFDNLKVDPGAWQTSSSHGIASSSSGTGTTNVVVQNCAFLDVLQGVLLSNHADRNWTVRNNTIQYTRDSGIIVFDPNQPTGIGGDDLLFEGNTMLDVGLDPSFAYPKHGVYSKGTNVTLRNNTIRRWGSDAAHPSAALSIRARNTTVEGNVLSDGLYGIDWSGYDTVAGISTIAYNRMSNIGQVGIEIDRQSGPAPTTESFVVANNTIVTSAGANAGRGIFLQATAGFVKLANNIVTGTHYYGLWVDGVPAGGFSEHNDLWDGNGGAERWRYNASEYTTLAGYQNATGQGSKDRVMDPVLDAWLTPMSATAVADAGTSAVDSSVAYVGDCTAALFHFCGTAPDIGAAELAATPAPPPPPPNDTTPPSVAITAPVAGSTVARTVLVSASATDAGGIASVSFLRDGTSVCVVTAAPYSCTMTLTQGWHTIVAKATDSAGNVATASIRVKASNHVVTAVSLHARRGPGALFRHRHHLPASLNGRPGRHRVWRARVPIAR